MAVTAASSASVNWLRKTWSDTSGFVLLIGPRCVAHTYADQYRENQKCIPEKRVVCMVYCALAHTYPL